VVRETFIISSNLARLKPVQDGPLEPRNAISASNVAVGLTIAAVPYWIQDLIVGLIATSAGVALTFNIAHAADRAAISPWWNRRAIAKSPRFWKTFGVLCLVFGVALLAVVPFGARGRLH